jgi:aminopeptidase N
MDIHKVAIVKGQHHHPLKYKYDGWMLNIDLDKTYKGGEKYTVYIDYNGQNRKRCRYRAAAAITDAKGLYFINPKGEEKDKPNQIMDTGRNGSHQRMVPHDRQNPTKKPPTNFR